MLGRGDIGPEVIKLQDELIKLRYMTLDQKSTGPGRFGPLTEAALIMFQRDHDIEMSGKLTPETETALAEAIAGDEIAHGAPAQVNTLLPPSGRGFTTYLRGSNGENQYGRASTIEALIKLAEAWADLHSSIPIQIGHLSKRGGGSFNPPHAGHQRGTEADIRPIKRDGSMGPTEIASSEYGRELTLEFVRLVKSRHPNIRIFFNDETFVQQGLTERVAGHHNHLHLRFPS